MELKMTKESHLRHNEGLSSRRGSTTQQLGGDRGCLPVAKIIIIIRGALHHEFTLSRFHFSMGYQWYNKWPWIMIHDGFQPYVFNILDNIFRKPCLLAKITCGLTDKKFWIALKLSSASGAKCVFSPMWIFSYIFEWFFSPNAPISIENIELLLKCFFWYEEFSHGQKIFIGPESDHWLCLSLTP